MFTDMRHAAHHTAYPGRNHIVHQALFKPGNIGTLPRGVAEIKRKAWRKGHSVSVWHIAKRCKDRLTAQQIMHSIGYGIGLGMFILLSLGQLLYLIDPLPVGDYPGMVRIMQIAAYPLLLTLPIRFSLAA